VGGGGGVGGYLNGFVWPVMWKKVWSYWGENTSEERLVSNFCKDTRSFLSVRKNRSQGKEKGMPTIASVKKKKRKAKYFSYTATGKSYEGKEGVRKTSEVCCSKKGRKSPLDKAPGSETRKKGDESGDWTFLF